MPGIEPLGEIRSPDVEADSALIARLQGGDEQAFVALVERYHPAMIRLAMTFVPSRAVAEEVVQEAWLGLVRGIHRFEGRSSLKTWLFRILVNRARTTGQRERRTLQPEWKGQPSVDPSRFGPDGRWSDPPRDWTGEVDDRLSPRETLEHLRSMLDQLPDTQRQVVLMRDVDGLDAREVCEVLHISQANQRVLLHRGRARLRAMLEGKVRSP